MKRIHLLLISLLLGIALQGQAPQILPLDPKVRTGTLKNGLTYFVVENSEPKGLGEFYIVQKVGSILEEENQRGLAHFLEHMAFNGTKHFPGNSLIEYLESIGVKFGANLNAYTAIDQTVYNISAVPVERESVIDSALLILHDWSNELLLEEEAIDKERGVIREELRTRASAQMRMTEAILPLVLPGSKYAHRMPGGLVEVVDNFEYQELRDYYEKWYRPDLQGIVVVGDFDGELVEKKIINLFSKIKMPADPAERTIYPVENNIKPLIGIVSDPEGRGIGLSIYFKKEKMPEELASTTVAAVQNYMNSMVVSMFNGRLAEAVRDPKSPLLGVRAGYGKFIITNTMNSFQVSINIKEGKIDEGVKMIVEELERMKKFGFTEAEYDRAKANLASGTERFYNEREKLPNSYYRDGLVNHFLTGAAFTSPEITYELNNKLIEGISLEQINQYAASLPTEQNVVMTLMMLEKEGQEIPTAEQLLVVYNSAKEQEVKPYQEEALDEPLIASLPPAGKVVYVENEPLGESTIWKLSNGAKVYLMKTDFKEDEILFQGISRGGYSQFADEDPISAKVITDLLTVGGLGEYNITNLGRKLAGKNASIGLKVNASTEALSGSCNGKDAETLFQLIHLAFTGLRKDEQAFELWKTRAETSLKNAEGKPSTIFSDSLQRTLYHPNPYTERFDLETLEKIDYDRVLQHGRERFDNAADFNFVFVGNIDHDQLKPLVEKYIGSLPGDPERREKRVELDYQRRLGRVTNEFDQVMKEPKSTVYSAIYDTLAYTQENRVLANITSQIFNLIFTRTIREEEQGTYGVSVRMSTSSYPKRSFSFVFNFDTDVALKDRLLERAYKEIENVIENGIEEDDLSKTLEYMNKSYNVSVRNNSYWLSILSSKALSDRDNYTYYKSILDGITSEKVNNFIRETLSSPNRIDVIMNGQLEELKEDVETAATVAAEGDDTPYESKKN